MSSSPLPVVLPEISTLPRVNTAYVGPESPIPSVLGSQMHSILVFFISHRLQSSALGYTQQVEA